MGNLVIHGNIRVNAVVPSGTGDNVLTTDPTTGDVGQIGVIDTSTFVSKTLPDGQIIVGNGSNVATGVTPTGDVTITNAGVTAIGTGVIVNNDINASAGIVLTKLAATTASRALVTDGSGFIVVSAVTDTELGYSSGVTSAIQTQIDSKVTSATLTTNGDIFYRAGGVVTRLPIGTNGYVLGVTAGLPVWEAKQPVPNGGTTAQYLAKNSNTDGDVSWVTLTTAKITDITASAAELNIMDGVTASTAEINYIDGVTSLIQTQLDAKQATITGSASTVVSVNLTANRAAIINGSGKFAASATTDTEIGYVSGVTSPIQGQINAKLSTSLAQNSIFVGNGSNQAAAYAAGSNGQVLTISAGVPTWTTPGSGGTVTSIDVSGTGTGMSFTGGPVTTTGTITLTGTLDVDNGGTGFASYAVGDILYANTTTTLAKLADVAAGSYLRSGGVSTAPVWSTTTLPNSATTGDILYASASNVYSNLGAGTVNHVLTSNGAGVAPSWQAAGAVGAWLLASGGTATGTNTFAMGTNPFIMTTGVTTGTGATAGHQLVGNSLTTGNLFDASSSSVSTGALGVFTSTSTVIDHTAGTNGLVEVLMSGANSTASKTAIGLYSKVINTGTTNTNIAGYFEASGGTTNNAIVVGAGNISLSGNLLTSGGTRIIGAGDASNINLATNTTTRIILGTNGSNTFLNGPNTGTTTWLTFTQSAQSNGKQTGLDWTGAAHTGMTASEIIDWNVNLNRTVQFTGSTGFATQRAYLIQAPTYAFVSATGTITTAATLAVSGAPTAGTNAAITNPLAFWTQAGAVRFDAPSTVFIANASGDTPTASTRLDVRGTGTGSNLIQRGADSSNNPRMTLADNGQFTVGTIGTDYLQFTNDQIEFFEGGVSRGVMFPATTNLRIYAGSSTGTGSLSIRADNGMLLTTSSGNQWGSWSTSVTGINLSNPGGAFSTATQDDAPQINFASSFWNGAAQVTGNYTIRNIASTSVNQLSRLAFTSDVSGSSLETMSISSDGNLNAATPSGTNLTLGGGATASELRFLEPSGGGTSYVGFKAPALAGNTVYDLPNAFPAVSGYVLASTDAGVMSWVASGGIGGSTGATDNSILRADGTGGSTVQSTGSSATLSDTGFLTVGGISAVGADQNIISNNAGLALFLETYNASTNTVLPALDLRRVTTGTPAVGIGVGINFTVETTAGNEIGSTIESVTTDIGSGTEDFDLVFKTMSAGATAAERLRILSTGDLVVPEGTLGKVLRTKVTVAGGATLRAIGSAPQTIIAAPGANKYLNIVSVAVSYNYNSAVYNFGGTEIPVFKVTGAATGWKIGTGIINAAADANRTLFVDNTASDWGVDVATNTAFVLTTVDAGDATTGDGDLDVVVYYTIEDTNT